MSEAMQTVVITGIDNKATKKDGTPLGKNQYTGKDQIMQFITFTDINGNSRTASCFSDADAPQFKVEYINTNKVVELKQNGQYTNIKYVGFPSADPTAQETPIPAPSSTQPHGNVPPSDIEKVKHERLVTLIETNGIKLDRIMKHLGMEADQKPPDQFNREQPSDVVASGDVPEAPHAW